MDDRPNDDLSDLEWISLTAVAAHEPVVFDGPVLDRLAALGLVALGTGGWTATDSGEALLADRRRLLEAGED